MWILCAWGELLFLFLLLGSAIPVHSLKPRQLRTVLSRRLQRRYLNSSSSSFSFHCGVPQSRLTSSTWAPALSRQSDPSVTPSHDSWWDLSHTLTHPKWRWQFFLDGAKLSSWVSQTLHQDFLKPSDEVDLFSPSWKHSWASSKKISTFFLSSAPGEQSDLSWFALLCGESRAKASE